MKGLIAFLVTMCVSPLSWCEVIEVGQENKLFVIKGHVNAGTATDPQMSIKNGDVIRFVNDDDFFHNVFSLSDPKLFDLGSFPKGEHRDVTFDVPGTVEIECAIHPEMKLTIEVE